MEGEVGWMRGTLTCDNPLPLQVLLTCSLMRRKGGVVYVCTTSHPSNPRSLTTIYISQYSHNVIHIYNNARIFFTFYMNGGIFHKIL